MADSEHDSGKGGLGTDEMRKIVLGRQIDAVARVISLIGDGMTIDDVTRALAEAEKAANFRCGFVMLDGEAEIKEIIVNEMLARGYATLDEVGAIKLTEAGKVISQVPLPVQIEDNL